jgi:stage V sporulation protein G
MSNISVDARAFPLDNPKSSTVSFASVTLKVDGEDVMAVNGVRVVESDKGLFVAMPQSQDKNNEYHDIAFPLTAGLRKEMNRAVLDAYEAEVGERKPSIGKKLQQGKEKARNTYGAQAPARQHAKARAAGRD